MRTLPHGRSRRRPHCRRNGRPRHRPEVDTEKYPELSARYNIRGIPNFIVFAGGKLVNQQAGVVGHEQMEAWLRNASAVPIV